VSHIDLMLPDGNLLGASDQGPQSPCVRGNPQGVAVRPDNYQTFGLRRRMIIKTDKADAIIASALSQLGKPFDNTALHDFLLEGTSIFQDGNSQNWRDTRSWFCAELIAFALEDAGYWNPKELAWPKNRISPTDLLLMFLFDDNFVNRDTFWQPVPGLVMGAGER
jgi:hypothetical protein